MGTDLAVLKAVDAEGLGSHLPDGDPIRAAENAAFVRLVREGVDVDEALQRARAEGNRIRAARGETPAILAPAEPSPRPRFQPPEPAGKERAVLVAIPRFFRGHRFATVGRYVKRAEAVAETRAALAALLAGEARAVSFVGRSEAGKTSLAAALVAALDQAQLDGDDRARRLLRSFLWLDALTLSRARSSFKLGDGEAPLVERALRASLLVLDELGAETVAGSDEVLDVIWRRWQEERPTIAMTGQPKEKLVQRYGEGVYTRLTRQGASRLVLCS